MARGWESKGVEEQINARDAERQKSEPTETPLELKLRAERNGIQLLRIRTLNLLQSTKNERYRQILEKTLDHIDNQLAKLDSAE